MSLRAFTMPKWGIEMTEGTVGEWKVAEGAAFRRGELIALIETDKITNEVEAEFDAVLARIVAKEGETLPVGALLGVFAEGDGGDVDAFVAAFRPAEGSLAAAASTTAPAAAAVTAGGVASPAVSPAPASGPSPASVRAAVIPDGANLSPEARKYAEANGLDLTAISGTGRNGRISLQDVMQATLPAATPVLVGMLPNVADPIESVRATPLARRLAAQHGIALSGLSGTGSRGRISKADVIARMTPPSTPAAAATGAAVSNTPEVLPMSSLRRTIARRLTEAKQTIPHFYLRVEVGVDKLLALRETANLVVGRKASVNDFIVCAAALALNEVPDVNVQVQGTDILRFPHADIAVAVATERGLVTPIVRAADTLRPHDISARVKALAEKAQAGKLTADDLEGGTFTVSNLGMFGVDQFDAIINPPQGAILAVGTSRRVFSEVEEGVGTFETRIAFSLSCDHRAIDGATGARFLASLKAIIEAPERLFA